jgi:predicted nucleic acid-binding protein
MHGAKSAPGLLAKRHGYRNRRIAMSVFLDTLLALPGVHGNLVPDAHLAALALEHGLTLCSTDGDFARFSSLRYLNPLAR